MVESSPLSTEQRLKKLCAPSEAGIQVRDEVAGFDITEEEIKAWSERVELRERRRKTLNQKSARSNTGSNTSLVEAVKAFDADRGPEFLELLREPF